MRTAQTIEQQKAQNAETGSGLKPKRRMNPNSLSNLVAPWTSETRPHSPGRPKDKAAELSRKVIENNEEQIYRGLAQKAMAGDAYAFSVLADRGYGKLKQVNVHQGDDEGGPINTSLKIEFVKPKSESA